MFTARRYIGARDVNNRRTRTAAAAAPSAPPRLGRPTCRGWARRIETLRTLAEGGSRPGAAVDAHLTRRARARATARGPGRAAPAQRRRDPRPQEARGPRSITDTKVGPLERPRRRLVHGQYPGCTPRADTCAASISSTAAMPVLTCRRARYTAGALPATPALAAARARHAASARPAAGAEAAERGCTGTGRGRGATEHRPRRAAAPALRAPPAPAPPPRRRPPRADAH